MSYLRHTYVKSRLEAYLDVDQELGGTEETARRLPERLS